MMCFAPDCNHYNEKHTCRFFAFPRDLKQRQRWIKLIRRADKEPNNGSRVCSCHFKDRVKENGPTMFEHNTARKLGFHSPERKKRAKKTKLLPVEENVTVELQPSSSATEAKSITTNTVEVQPCYSETITEIGNIIFV